MCDQYEGPYAWRMPLIKLRLALAELSSTSGERHTQTGERVIEQARRLVEKSHDSKRIPFKIEAHLLLGMALKAQGLSEESKTTLDQALALAGTSGFELLKRQIVAELLRSK
ncbi:hypothetical protein ACFL27_15865 [candidate division CSSED10-310 bacterium]|uniref:MalT-like TPR region domain-containing protein n=1 Tax=candidate division CSSED10-310 bacterium TaxID=2855610 RepID=A0ABV6YZN2_UNCC1